MKKIILFPVLALMISITGCNTDNENNDYETLDGSWTLTNGSGGFSGRDDDFDFGTITWDFNTTNHTVIVVNNNTDENKVDGLDSGTYHYLIDENEEEGCNLRFFISENDMGCYSISNGHFTVDHSPNDGVKLEFSRYLMTLRP